MVEASPTDKNKEAVIEAKSSPYLHPMSKILAPIKQEHVSLEFALALSMGLALMADVDAVCARYVSVFFTDSYLVLGEPRLVRRTITVETRDLY